MIVGIWRGNLQDNNRNVTKTSSTVTVSSQKARLFVLKSLRFERQSLRQAWQFNLQFSQEVQSMNALRVENCQTFPQINLNESN